MNHALSHLGIAMYAFVPLESVLLNMASLQNPFADNRRRLSCLHLRKLLERHNRHLTMNVYTIQ